MTKAVLTEQMDSFQAGLAQETIRYMLKMGMAAPPGFFDILGPTTGYNIDSMDIENVSRLLMMVAKVVYTIDTISSP